MIMELSVPFDLDTAKDHHYKTDKYSALVTDIENYGYQVEFLAIEIGSRGFLSKDNTQRLKSYLFFLKAKRPKYSAIRDNLSKMAVVSSFSICCAKDEPIWGDYKLLEQWTDENKIPDNHNR